MTHSILVVDSDDAFSTILKEGLESTGEYQVSMVHAGGDALELTFLAAGERFSLVAEVLRTSKNGEVLHVRFAPMRETTRDRIIGSLFKGAVAAKRGS